MDRLKDQQIPTSPQEVLSKGTPFFHNFPRFKNMHLSYILTFFVSAEKFIHVQKHV